MRVYFLLCSQKTYFLLTSTARIAIRVRFFRTKILESIFKPSKNVIQIPTRMFAPSKPSEMLPCMIALTVCIFWNIFTYAYIYIYIVYLYKSTFEEATDEATDAIVGPFPRARKRTLIMWPNYNPGKFLLHISSVKWKMSGTCTEKQSQITRLKNRVITQLIFAGGCFCCWSRVGFACDGLCNMVLCSHVVFYAPIIWPCRFVWGVV